MKSSPPKPSLLTVAAALLGMGGTHTGKVNPMRLHASEPTFVPRTLLRLPPRLSQSPPYNQRKVRKARRARWAAGDRKAFR